MSFRTTQYFTMQPWYFQAKYLPTILSNKKKKERNNQYLHSMRQTLVKSDEELVLV